jgi:hypothetical protein
MVNIDHIMISSIIHHLLVTSHKKHRKDVYLLDRITDKALLVFEHIYESLPQGHVSLLPPTVQHGFETIPTLYIHFQTVSGHHFDFDGVSEYLLVIEMGVATFAH